MTHRTDSDLAEGQLQFNDHAGTKFHGTVTCLQVDPADEGMPRTARIGGEYDDETGAPQSFRIFITNTDFGGAQDQDEMLTFTRAADGEQNCDPVDDEMASMTLGRGNIVIHKDKAPAEGKGGKPALALR